MPDYTASLTGEQSEARKSILSWFHAEERDEFKLGGWAGVGKSHLLSHLLRQSFPSNTAVCTLTGKAASVLRDKGVSVAQTLHSLFYIPTTKDGRLHFVPRSKEELGRIPLLVVDEASMISTPIYQDVMRHDIPVLWVGDHGQLPPVGEDPGLMKPENLDARLETIMRQALNSPIIRLAHTVRENRRLDPFLGEGVKITDYNDPNWLMGNWTPDTQIICSMNDQRNILNKMLRAHLNLNPLYPVPGDRIICLKNAPDSGLFNGSICVIKEVHRRWNESFIATIETDAGVVIPELLISLRAFNQPTLPKDVSHGYWRINLPFDYAYALTCHKAQGSEYDRVLIAEVKTNAWDRSRWAYTAITRAKEHVTWVS